MENMSNDKKEFYIFINEELPKLKIFSPRTVGNLATISNRVLNSIPDYKSYSEWDAVEIMKSYSSSGKISGSSLYNYLSRLRSALEKFNAYKSGYLTEECMNIKKIKRNCNYAALNQTLETFSLPIPIRSNLILNISNLPLDLTEDEAEKISRVIKSYAIEGGATNENSLLSNDNQSADIIDNVNCFSTQ